MNKDSVDPSAVNPKIDPTIRNRSLEIPTANERVDEVFAHLSSKGALEPTLPAPSAPSPDKPEDNFTDDPGPQNRKGP